MAESVFAVAAAPDVFLYEEPGHSPSLNDSTISDEIFSGWAVRFLGEADENGWILAETHYGYTGYVKRNAFRITDREHLYRGPAENPSVRVIEFREIDLMSEPKVQGCIRETLLRGSFVELLRDGTKEDPDSGWALIRSASGRMGYVSSACLGIRKDDDGYLTGDGEKDYFCTLAQKVCREVPENDLRDAIVRSAMTYLDTQYRWGGKSAQGIDCSGLSFMSYMRNGILIYRDAGIREHFPVHPTEKENLKKGDLIFFPGHVAVFMGEGRFIHATAYRKTPLVTISSLLPEDPLYREDLAGSIESCGSIF